MDVVMAERVNKLARSLKDLHLASTFEEAYKRAEEILSGNAQQDSGEKTLNELMAAQTPIVKKEVVGLNAPVEEIFIESQSESSNPPSETQ